MDSLSCSEKVEHYIKQSFCSIRCGCDYQWMKKKEAIRTENNLLNSRTARKYLFEEYGNQCSNCLLTEWLGKPIALVADYIDGAADNWSIDNLRLLCNNCDAQTETYKNKIKEKVVILGDCVTKKRKVTNM